MAKPKTLEQLRAEKEQVETQPALQTAQAGASGEQKASVWQLSHQCLTVL